MSSTALPAPLATVGLWHPGARRKAPQQAAVAAAGAAAAGARAPATWGRCRWRGAARERRCRRWWLWKQAPWVAGWRCLGKEPWSPEAGLQPATASMVQEDPRPNHRRGRHWRRGHLRQRTARLRKGPALVALLRLAGRKRLKQDQGLLANRCCSQWPGKATCSTGTAASRSCLWKQSTGSGTTPGPRNATAVAPMALEPAGGQLVAKGQNRNLRSLRSPRYNRKGRRQESRKGTAVL